MKLNEKEIGSIIDLVSNQFKEIALSVIDLVSSQLTFEEWVIFNKDITKIRLKILENKLREVKVK